jgi:hypothetical protein
VFNYYRGYNPRKERAKENWNPKGKDRIPVTPNTKRDVIDRCDNMCENCHVNSVQNIHHIDGNPTNNSMFNLQGVCYKCHMYLHHGDKEEKEMFIKKLYGKPVAVRLAREQVEDILNEHYGEEPEEYKWKRGLE